MKYVAVTYVGLNRETPTVHNENSEGSGMKNEGDFATADLHGLAYATRHIIHTTISTS